MRTLSADSTLSEWELGVRTLEISLDQEEFLDFGGLSDGDFSLVNAPGGIGDRYGDRGA